MAYLSRVLTSKHWRTISTQRLFSARLATQAILQLLVIYRYISVHGHLATLQLLVVHRPSLTARSVCVQYQVTNVDEAVTWLGYTYLSIRMRRNPLAYGISMEEKHADPMLVRWRRDLIERAAQRLRQSRTHSEECVYAVQTLHQFGSVGF